MSSKQFPYHVTIPTPMYSPVPRGIQARGPHAMGPLGANVRVRVTKTDFDMIISLCDKLGMKPAAYLRWCAVEVAKQLT